MACRPAFASNICVNYAVFILTVGLKSGSTIDVNSNFDAVTPLLDASGDLYQVLSVSTITIKRRVGDYFVITTANQDTQGIYHKLVILDGSLHTVTTVTLPAAPPPIQATFNAYACAAGSPIDSDFVFVWTQGEACVGTNLAQHETVTPITFYRLNVSDFSTFNFERIPLPNPTPGKTYSALRCTVDPQGGGCVLLVYTHFFDNTPPDQRVPLVYVSSDGEKWETQVLPPLLAPNNTRYLRVFLSSSEHSVQGWLAYGDALVQGFVTNPISVGIHVNFTEKLQIVRIPKDPRTCPYKQELNYWVKNSFVFRPFTDKLSDGWLVLCNGQLSHVDSKWNNTIDLLDIDPTVVSKSTYAPQSTICCVTEQGTGNRKCWLSAYNTTTRDNHTWTEVLLFSPSVPTQPLKPLSWHNVASQFEQDMQGVEASGIWWTPFCTVNHCFLFTSPNNPSTYWRAVSDVHTTPFITKQAIPTPAYVIPTSQGWITFSTLGNVATLNLLTKTWNAHRESYYGHSYFWGLPAAQWYQQEYYGYNAQDVPTFATHVLSEDEKEWNGLFLADGTYTYNFTEYTFCPFHLPPYPGWIMLPAQSIGANGSIVLVHNNSIYSTTIPFTPKCEWQHRLDLPFAADLAPYSAVGGQEFVAFTVFSPHGQQKYLLITYYPTNNTISYVDLGYISLLSSGPTGTFLVSNGLQETYSNITWMTASLTVLYRYSQHVAEGWTICNPLTLYDPYIQKFIFSWALHIQSNTTNYWYGVGLVADTFEYYTNITVVETPVTAASPTYIPTALYIHPTQKKALIVFRDMFQLALPKEDIYHNVMYTSREQYTSHSKRICTMDKLIDINNNDGCLSPIPSAPSPSAPTPPPKDGAVPYLIIFGSLGGIVLLSVVGFAVYKANSQAKGSAEEREPLTKQAGPLQRDPVGGTDM